MTRLVWNRRSCHGGNCYVEGAVVKVVVLGVPAFGCYVEDSMKLKRMISKSNCIIISPYLHLSITLYCFVFYYLRVYQNSSTVY